MVHVMLPSRSRSNAADDSAVVAPAGEEYLDSTGACCVEKA